MPCVESYPDHPVLVHENSEIRGDQENLFNKACRRLKFSFISDSYDELTSSPLAGGGGYSEEFVSSPTSYSSKESTTPSSPILSGPSNSENVSVFLEHNLNVKELDLSAHQLQAIPKIVENLHLLEVLNLSHNSLTVEEAVETSKTLVDSSEKFADNDSLNIDYNLPEVNLASLTSSEKTFNFSLLTKLTMLNFSYNQLTTCPPSLTLLPQLTNLNLSHNLLTSLPSQLRSARTLHTLNLSFNRLEVDLESLPSWFNQLTHCKSLDLSNNPLGNLFQFPQGFGNNSRKLKFLELGCVDARDFPGEVTDLLDLKHLSLRNRFPFNRNSMVCLPNNLVNLQGLVKLDVAGVDLCQLPDNLGLMKNLQILDVSRNKMSWFPVSLVHLPSLKALIGHNNNLLMLPLDFEMLTTLEVLLLANNSIAELPDNLASLPSLSTLDVYNNQLTSLPPGLLNSAHLVRCDLALNPLVTVGTDNQYESLTEGTKTTIKPMESITENTEVTNELMKSVTEDIDITNKLMKVSVEVTEKQVVREKDPLLSRVRMLLGDLRTWDGRLGEENILVLEDEVFMDRKPFRLVMRETEENLEDEESSDIECYACYSKSYMCACTCDLSFESLERKDEAEENEDSSMETAQCEESSSEEWEDCGVYSPTKLDVKHNLSRMHLEQFWGSDQFCPADLHHLPMSDQLASKWEKAYLLKTAQQVGRKNFETKSPQDIQKGQFEDSD